MAGAYLGVGEPDVVINVGVSGPAWSRKHRPRDGNHKPGEFTLGEVAEVIKRTAYKVTRVARSSARKWPSASTCPSASRTCPLPRRPPWGTPWAKSSRAWACPPSAPPAPPPCLPCSTTPSKRAARSPRPCGGLSGAFIPVSEDSSIEAATRSGALSLEKLEAMTSVCSVAST